MTGRNPWWSRIGALFRRSASGDPAPDAGAALGLAIADLRTQHVMIVDQAAQIVAAADREGVLLDRALADRERLTASAREAVRGADAAAARGDDSEAARWEATAEALATRILSVEREIEARRAASATAAEAAARARDMVERSATVVRARIAEHQRLRTDLDEARLQEQLNDTLRLLDPAAGGAATATAELGRSVEERLANARALTEIRSEPAGARRLQLEHELSVLDARSVVSSLRRDLPEEPPAGEVPPDEGR